MSKKNLLMIWCLAILCAHKLYAQQESYRTMGLDEMFRLADENSKSIQTYKTGIEAADEGVKAAKAQRLPDVNTSLSFSYLGDGRLWDRDFSNAQTIPMPHFGNNFALEAQQWFMPVEPSRVVSNWPNFRNKWRILTGKKTDKRFVSC